MALCTETSDPVLDVINCGFETVPALGLQEPCYCIGTHRKWKVKDAPVTCSDTVLLAPPRLCKIVAAFLLGKNDVPHP